MAKKTLEQHKKDVEHWGPRGVQMVQDAMEKVGQEVIAYARKTHLHGPKMPRGVSGGFEGSTLGVVSSDLRKRLTIKSSVKAAAVTVAVGTNLKNRGYPYPRAHELGLGKMPERPWLRPSVKAKQDKLRTDIKEAWVMSYGK